MESVNWTRESILTVLRKLLEIGVDLRFKQMEASWNELYNATVQLFGT